MYTVSKTGVIFSTKEAAEVLYNFLVEANAMHKDYYKVEEIFIDCFYKKIQKGYDIWLCQMTRDGTVIKADKFPRYAPTKWGFKRRAFVPTIDGKAMHLKLYNLALNESDIISQCERERVKTFLDDSWRLDKGL